jgi:hypothetical protein
MTKMPRDHRRSRVVVTIAYLLSFLFLAAGQALAAEGIVVAVGEGTGVPGGTADVKITLTDPTGQGAGAGVFVTFPLYLGALTIDPASDCVIAQRLESLNIMSALPLTDLEPGSQGFRVEIALNPFLKHCTGDPTQLCNSNADCATAGGTCATKSCTGDPTQACNSNADCESAGGTCATIVVPLGTGDLATCTFHIPDIAEPGTVKLTASNVLVSDASGTALEPASGTDGSVTVVPCTKSAECPEGRVCLDQVCSPKSCTEQTDCPDDSVCVITDDVGTCQALPGCTTDADCPEGICVNPPGACTIVPCSVEEPCPTPPDRVCVEGICAPAPTPAPSETPTPTDTPTPLPTETPTPPPPDTPTPTNTPTFTLTPTKTATPTAPATPTPTATATLPLPSPTPPGLTPSSVDTDGCNMSQTGLGGAPSGGALLWLLVPVALMVYRRRR